jgi:hypothetical protein
MRRLPALLAGAVLMLVAATAAAAAAGWQTYRYPDQGFSIELPGEPDWKEAPLDTALGKASLRLGSLRTEGNGALVLGVVTYLSPPADEQQALDAAVAGAAANTRSQVISSTAITVDGAAGREASFRRPGALSVKARFIWRGARLYQVLVFGSEASGLPPEGERVLASFHLLH